MDQKLLNKLIQREKEGTIRSLSTFDDFIDFYSNDYLGLSSMETDSNYPLKYGSTGSRLISGNSKTLCKQKLQLLNSLK